jgi:hypothetical protein
MTKQLSEVEQASKERQLLADLDKVVDSMFLSIKKIFVGKRETRK